MKFPTTDLLDDFNRGDSTGLGASWSAWFGGAMSNVVSNVAGNVSSADNAWVAQPGANCESWLTISTLPSANQFVSAYLRISTLVGSTPNAYQVRSLNQASNNFLIRRVDSGVGTNIGTFTQAVAAGDSIGIRANGTTFYAWYKAAAAADWVLIGTATDATYLSAGYIGFQPSESTSRVNDFGGGTYLPGKDVSFPKKPSLIYLRKNK